MAAVLVSVKKLSAVKTRSIFPTAVKTECFSRANSNHNWVQHGKGLKVSY